MERQRNREEFGENGIEDMINILELTEQNLLRNLRIRYDKELIYTYTGSILVAVNPYKMFNIYGVDVVRKYEGQVLDQQPPHLFAIGSNSYSKMVSDNENQVIVISGESGAGKTESTKLLMQYLAAVNKSGTNIITERILEANPLLESFGNAKTVKNDNSSRFGKYVELYFKSGSILGAKTSDYLLEKSRIVSQAANERNYHVFYEMLVGLSGAEKQKYGLQSAENYFYLNQGGATRIQGKDDLRDYQNLTASLNVLGFTAIEQETIIKMLASVLHIGNVYFTQVQSQHHSAGVKIDSEDQIKWVCHLLGLNQDWLHSALTTKVTEARDERLRSPLTIDQAVESRDAVAKALYQRLFSWLVERVNHIVRGHSHERTSSLAILDIFGFEDFKQNSLEQFCINYANESLQYYFNKHIFKLEQEIYRRERINWSQIRFHDNQPTLDLISKKREGIIYLLDDESNFPKATDQSFLEKCHRTHTGNSLYEKPRMSAPQFGIKHYAGLVTYNVKHFLDKNKDTLRSDVVELLIQSKNQIISKMFSDLKDSTVSKTISKTSGFYVKMRPKTATVAASFHESLTTLVDAMAKCNPWFVRCIKPNDGKSAMVFDDQVVLSQLRYTGMLETINIRKMGYPIRYRFKVFADRYFVLLGRRNRGPSTLSDDKALCEAVLRQQGRGWEQFWAVGVSKLFLKESLNNELERARNQMIAGAVLVLQQYSRGYLARKRYLRTRHAAIMLQSGLRRWRARTNYLAVRKGVVRAQAQFRMMLQRRRYEKLKAEYRRRLEADARNRAEEQRRRDEDRRRNRVISQRPAAPAAAGDVPLPSNRITRSSSFSSSVGSLSGSMAVAHLEIPSELGYIFSKIEEWRPSHTDQHVNESSAPVELRDLELKLPHDINSYEMLKYVNVFCKEPDLKRTQFPIKSPFLDTRNDADVKEALAIFKLILRYMGDANLGDKKQKVIADYIVQKGQVNENLRDEIYIQMINQTLGLKNEQAQEKGWMLISNCLSCFQPSSTFFKYLLKYVTDHAYNGYKLHCQHKLLQCMEIPPQLNRVYLPTQLEWKAAKQRSCMGLNAFCGDGLEGTYHVESWTTAQEFAAHVLHTKGINEGRHGWTVALRDGEDVYECGGYDYVLDLIGEMELPPAFPFCRSYFLVTSDRSKDHTRRAQYTNMPHHPDNPRLMPMPTEELNQPVPASPRPAPPAGTFFNYPSVASSLNGDYLSREDLLSTNVLNRREAGAPNPDLSKESILNIRYVRRPPSMAPESASSTLTRDTAAPEAPPLATDSKMNQRYITPVDLPKSKLNQRYTIAQDTFFTNGDVVTGAPNGEQNGHVSNGEDWDVRNGSKFAKGPNAVRASMPPMDHSARDQILRKGRPIKTGRSGSEVSDLDRWVDDVFDRVLDGSVDDVDNPQHLEHRLKGGGDDPFSLQPNSTLINTGVPAGSTTFPVNMTTFPVLPGAGTSIPVGDPTQQLLAQQMAAQQYAAQQQFLQQQQQARAVQQAAAAQQFAAQQMAQQHLDQQQQQQQLLMAQQADPTRVMKAQLATKNLENELLLKDIEQKKLKKELAALANASLRNSGSSAGAPAVSALHFDLPPSARSPPAQPPTPAYSLPSPQVVSPALPAQPAEIDTSRPGGVKTLKGVFEKKRKDVGDAFTRQSVLQSIRTHPPQEAKVSFSTRVDSIPQPTPTSPPTPAAPTSKSPPLPQPPSPAVSPRPPSPAVSPPPAQRSSSSPGPPTAPPPPPIQTSAMKDESGEGPIKVATGGTRRFKNNGKFQWPPPKEEERREEPLVGKLEIQERREESIRRKAPRTSTSGDGAVKVDVGSKIDMKSRQKEIESKLNQAWGKSTENLADVPPKVISPRPLSPRLAAGKREKPPTPPQLPPPPPPPQIPTEPAQPAPVPVSSPAPPPPQPRKLEQPEPMFDLKSLERIQSVLYAQNTGPFYTYRNVNWNLEVRKEVFTPSENPEDPVIINLIFAQIVMDCISTACIRIQKEDKIKMNSILENAGISRRNVLDEHPLQVKKDVIETAREWPYYFSRLFSVNGGRQHGNVHMIGVSHSGVRLLTKEKEFKEDKLRVLRHFRFEEIKHVSVPKEHTLQIHTTEDDYVLLYTHKAEQIRDLIDAYCIECEANARYVRALKNYKTKDTTLLSFDKGDLIKLTNKNMTLDRGWLYGSAHGRIGLFPESYIQPVPLHEIPDDIYARINKNKSKVDLQSTDSLNGFIPSHNSHSKMSTTEKKIRSKKLKSEPVSNGYIIKTKAVTNGFIKAKPVSNGFLKKKNPLINGVNHVSNGGPHVKHGPRNAREEEHDHFDPVISGRKGLLRISKPYKDVRSDISSVATTSGPAKFSMLEFAMLNYRESPYRFPVGTSDSGSVHSHRNKMDSLRIKTADRVKRGSKRGDWTWKDQVALIKWTKDPIQMSLLKFESSSLNKSAIDCFHSVMRYMGDYPLSKGQKPTDCVYSILMSCHNQPNLTDEVYCQLTKQVTNNRSTKPESEQQGWRLMCILSSFFKCTPNLERYLFNFLEQAAFDTNRAHNVAAQTSLQNLRQTLRYGGRKNVPNRMEIEALTRGRNTKRQMCILPGGTPIMLNMKSSSVVQEIVMQICSMLGISEQQHQLEAEEFTIFYVIEAENRYCPLKGEEYVFDITTELSNQKKTYYLLFQRTSWVHTVNLSGNPRYIDVVYNQCIPDYLDGFLLSVVSNTLPEHMKDEIAELACLQIRCNEKPGTVQKQKEINFYIPRNVQHLNDMKPQNWTNKVNQMLTRMPHLSPVECQKEFLKIVQMWPLFGATFFNIKDVLNDNRVKGECMLAVNKSGIFFLDPKTHATRVVYRFEEIISTRRGNAREGGRDFLEVKIGDLYSQKIIRLVTDQGADISSLVTQYMRIINTSTAGAR